ncbi:metal ABC transporter solute-binding protein, Zn/Mn family [Miniphocaeibacter massiliensis]|uniref:metal ABC transporter solute-binding protein, Zn/Mn family n=1 Tax=Miniphocaeibacter massiliensis TaxID=2041841 RepID=UPI000C1C6C29|nr:zinc ABC transporter substrate-binding protein [Miniphocaeibacter massiliensis]
MKKIISVLMVCMILLTSCTSKNVNKEKGGKPTIYTSIYPIYYVTSNIVGDKINVENIIPNDIDAHSWEPTPKDMAKLEDASLILINGIGMESWVDSVVNTIGSREIHEVNEGIELIKLTEHDHDKDLRESHNHGDFDPHIWLSIKNMKIISKNVYKKVVDLDKDNEKYYLENFNELVIKLENLEKDYENKLSRIKDKSIVVPHEAFNYLGRDYEINQIAIEGINSTDEPDLGKMAEIVNEAKENKINTIFYEYGDSDKIAKTIAGEINGQVLPLCTLEKITNEQEKNNDDYISIMYKNLENLEKSFER